jgi:hypothetical protein
MSVTGLDEVTTKLKAKLNALRGEQSQNAVITLLQVGAANAASLTPIDSSTLINSQHYRTWEAPEGVVGAVFYEAPYAKWVHEMPGVLKGQPRNHFGKTGAGMEFGGGTETGRYWDPDAEPQFLKKGMAEMKLEAQNILKAAYGVT